MTCSGLCDSLPACSKLLRHVYSAETLAMVSHFLIRANASYTTRLQLVATVCACRMPTIQFTKVCHRTISHHAPARCAHLLSSLQYRVQLTEGCGNARCTNAFCATARGSTLAPSVASVLALQLVRQGMPTPCVPDPSSSAHHRPGPALLCKDVKSGGTILHRVLQTSAYASLLLDDVNGTTSASHAATSTV